MTVPFLSPASGPYEGSAGCCHAEGREFESRPSRHFNPRSVRGLFFSGHNKRGTEKERKSAEKGLESALSVPFWSFAFLNSRTALSAGPPGGTGRTGSVGRDVQLSLSGRRSWLGFAGQSSTRCEKEDHIPTRFVGNDCAALEHFLRPCQLWTKCRHLNAVRRPMTPVPNRGRPIWPEDAGSSSSPWGGARLKPRRVSASELRPEASPSLDSERTP